MVIDFIGHKKKKNNYKDDETIIRQIKECKLLSIEN